MGLLHSRTVTDTPQSAAAPQTPTRTHTQLQPPPAAPVCLCPYAQDRPLCAGRPWGPPESSGSGAGGVLTCVCLVSVLVWVASPGLTLEEATLPRRQNTEMGLCQRKDYPRGYLHRVVTPRWALSWAH